MRSLLLAAAVAAAGCGLQPGNPGGKAEPAAKAGPKTEPIDAQKLYDDYKEDGAKAAGMYGGRDIRVKLVVSRVDQQGELLYVFQKLGTDNLFPHVEATVPIADASKVKVGRTVTVVGKVARGDHLSVMLSGRAE